MLLEALRLAGPIGLTDHEGEEATGIGGNTYRPARQRLAKSGDIVKLGKKRLATSKIGADVWVLAEFEPTPPESPAGSGA